MLQKKYKNINGFIWIGLSQVILLFGNFLVLKLLATSLSIADFGYYSLCMTFVLFARQVIYDPFSMVIAKYCSVTHVEKKISSLSLQVIKYSVDKAGVFILILASVSLMVDIFAVGNTKLSSLIFFCLIYLLANGAQGIYINVFNSIGERKFAAVFSMVDTFLKIVLVMLFFKFFDNDLFVVLVSVSVGALVALFLIRYFISIRFLDEKSNSIEVKKIFKNNFIVCLPLFLPSLLNAFKSIGDRWMLAGFLGIDELAAYTVLLQVGYFPVILFFGIAQTYMGPRIYQLSTLKNSNECHMLKKIMWSVLLITIVFGCVSSGVALMLADRVLDILVGSNYKIYAKYLSIFVFAGSLGACAGVFQLIIFGIFDTKISSKLIAISIGSGLAAIFILIYFFKFEGAIGGLVLAGVIPILIFSWHVRKKLSILGQHR